MTGKGIQKEELFEAQSIPSETPIVSKYRNNQNSAVDSDVKMTMTKKNSGIKKKITKFSSDSYL